MLTLSLGSDISGRRIKDLGATVPAKKAKEDQHCPTNVTEEDQGESDGSRREVAELRYDDGLLK